MLVGGDVSAGPFPVECLERLRGLGDRAVWIRGNADREIHGWPTEQLSDEQLAFLRALEETVVLDVDELGPVLFCHGSPRSDEEIITQRSPDLRLEAALAGVQQQTVVHGHTHVAYDREWGLYRLICPGSVGMPYADLPGAYWGMFGPGFEQRHTVYDFEAAADRVRGSGVAGGRPRRRGERPHRPAGGRGDRLLRAHGRVRRPDRLTSDQASGRKQLHHPASERRVEQAGGVPGLDLEWFLIPDCSRRQAHPDAGTVPGPDGVEDAATVEDCARGLRTVADSRIRRRRCPHRRPTRSSGRRGRRSRTTTADHLCRNHAEPRSSR